MSLPSTALSSSETMLLTDKAVVVSLDNVATVLFSINTSPECEKATNYSSDRTGRHLHLCGFNSSSTDWESNSLPRNVVHFAR